MPVATKKAQIEAEQAQEIEMAGAKKLYRLLVGKHLSAEGDIYYGKNLSPENPQGDLIELTDEEAAQFGDRIVSA